MAVTALALMSAILFGGVAHSKAEGDLCGANPCTLSQTGVEVTAKSFEDLD